MHFISTVFRVRGQWEKQKSSGNSKILQRILAVNTTKFYKVKINSFCQ